MYDAENRITNVLTSADSINWDNDAFYQYYDHGPLARTILGEQQVQGVNYAYNLQGWLKSINPDIYNGTGYTLKADGSTGGVVGKMAYNAVHSSKPAQEYIKGRALDAARRAADKILPGLCVAQCSEPGERAVLPQHGERWRSATFLRERLAGPVSALSAGGELETLLHRPERYTNLASRNKVLMSLLIYQALYPVEMEAYG